VTALLEEYKNMRLLESKPEHDEKWIKRGESPTKRLICKSFFNYIYSYLSFYRDENISSHWSSLSETHLKSSSGKWLFY
jgi:hypothetical protein